MKAKRKPTTMDPLRKAGKPASRQGSMLALVGGVAAGEQLRSNGSVWKKKTYWFPKQLARELAIYCKQAGVFEGSFVQEAIREAMRGGSR